jgi:hypothetical protein
MKTEAVSVKAAPGALTPGASPLPGTAAAAPATESEVAAAVVNTRPATEDHTYAGKRRRRWPLIPVAGAVGAVAIGFGGGGAFAYFATAGSGAGQAKGGSLATVSVVATTGPADLLPGGTGAVYFTLHNTSPSGATFDVVEPGATVQSSNIALCGDNNVSIAQTLPYMFSPAVTVSANGTSGPQSIPALVALSSSAPTTCQGLTFTVTITLTGRSA